MFLGFPSARAPLAVLCPLSPISPGRDFEISQGGIERPPPRPAESAKTLEFVPRNPSPLSRLAETRVTSAACRASGRDYTSARVITDAISLFAVGRVGVRDCIRDRLENDETPYSFSLVGVLRLTVIRFKMILKIRSH